MSEKVNLKVMSCPTCGASLKAENSTTPITCVYCGNNIVPVPEVPASAKANEEGRDSIRIDGIKTPSSALAYMEIFFEEYDWDSFVFDPELSIHKIDLLVESLKVSSADDKNTWIAAFRAIYVPYMRKADGCTRLLNLAVNDYKHGDYDAYSKFDAYKRISTVILDERNPISLKLEKILERAARYGASVAEQNDLKSCITKARGGFDLQSYYDFMSIPAIGRVEEEKNAEIARKLSDKGIDAESDYSKASTLIKDKKYADALNTLLPLEGYRDSSSLAEKLDKYYLISGILEIENRLYYYSEGKGNTLSLYLTAGDKLARKPVIKKIKTVITNHADIIYYLDAKEMLRSYCLSTGVGKKIYNKKLSIKNVHSYGHNLYLYTDSEDGQLYDIIELDLITGNTHAVIKNVIKLIAFNENYVVYTASVKGERGKVKVCTFIADLCHIATVTPGADRLAEEKKTVSVKSAAPTLTTINLGDKEVSVESFVGDAVVYTTPAPNKHNLNLYIKSFDSNQPDVLLEENIYRYCNTISNKIFYYIGNAKNQTLVNINADGSNRREWPLYLTTLLFEEAKWLYFIRKSGYNSVLCKSRMDGSEFSIIAADAETYVCIKNGYLYYMDSESALYRVRMDGSGLMKLCDDVEQVLTVHDDKIVFLSVDGNVSTEGFDNKLVKSIYAVDFSGRGKQKLVYDVKVAQKHDDDTVYFISTGIKEPDENKKKGSRDEESGKPVDTLYSLNVHSYEKKKLLDIELVKKFPLGFLICMIIMSICFTASIVNFSNGGAMVSSLGIFGGIISLVVGLILKKKNN